MTDTAPVAATLLVVTLGGMFVFASGCADPIDERLRRADERLEAGAVTKAAALARSVLDDAPSHWSARLMLARVDIAQSDWSSAENRLATLEREARSNDADASPGLPEAGFARARRVTQQLYDRWSRQLVPSDNGPTRTDEETLEILRIAYALAASPTRQSLHARQLARVYMARAQGGAADAYGDAARWAPPQGDLWSTVLAGWKPSASEAFGRAWRRRRDVIRLATDTWSDGHDAAFHEVDQDAQRPPNLAGDKAPSEVWRASLRVPVDRDLEIDSNAGVEAARATAKAHLIGRLRRLALTLLELPTDTDLNDFGRQRAVEALLEGVAAQEISVRPGRADVTVWMTRVSLETMAFELAWLLETTVHGRTLAELAASGCLRGSWTLEVVRRAKPDLRETVQSAETCQTRRAEIRDSASFELEPLLAECVCRIDS